MTLAIALVAGDGIAVAADSRTSRQFSATLSRVASDFTHKVFQVANVAVATYGYAFLKGRNIAGHMAQFATRYEGAEEASAQTVANELNEYFGDLFVEHMKVTEEAPIPEGATALGFLVAGYDSGVGCLYEVCLPAGTVAKQGDSTTGTGAWRGQTDVVTRLLKGVDLDLLPRYAGPEGRIQHVMGLQPDFAKMEYAIMLNMMNLQDAVDLAVLLIRTTIDVQRLTHGTVATPGSWPGVGGPIEIATVTARNGFQWLQATQLQAERPSGMAEKV